MHRGAEFSDVPPVSKDQVVSGLRELADIDYQRRVWLALDPRGEMSSFEEAVETVFDDSGLGPELEAMRSTFGTFIDAQLAALDRLLHLVDARRSVEDVIDDPIMARVRAQAAAILRYLDDAGPDSSGADGR